MLCDLKCNYEHDFILPLIFGNSHETSQAIEETINMNLKYGRNGGDRVGLIMRGLFQAPRANPKIKETGNDWPKFKIMEMEKIVAIPEDAPPLGHCSDSNR